MTDFTTPDSSDWQIPSSHFPGTSSSTSSAPTYLDSVTACRSLSNSGSCSTRNRSRSPGRKIRKHRPCRPSDHDSRYWRGPSWESVSGGSKCSHRTEASFDSIFQLPWSKLDNKSLELPPGTSWLVSFHQVKGRRQRNPATARWVVGDILYSRGSSEDRGPATGSRGTTPRQPLRRKPNASNLRRSPTPSSSQQSSYSSQYSEAQVPMTAIRKPITASPRRSGSLEQPEPLAVSQSSLSSPNTGVIKKSVSFKLPEPQTTKGTPWGGSPRTGAESAAGAAYRRYGKPPPPFNPTTSCTSGFWRSASRKTASTNKRQISFRSRIFPASNTSSNPPQFRAHQWFRQSTAVASRQTDTQQGSAAKAETSKAGRGQRRDRTGYMEARTIRGRQGQQGRHLRAKTLRKGSRRRFWR